METVTLETMPGHSKALFSSVRLYSFPIAAVTNYYKLSVLKTIHIYYLKFWRSEV